MKFLLRTPRAQAMLASLLGSYLVFALRTTRWTLDGQEHFAPLGAGAPAVFAFWHEFLPLMPALSLIARRLPSYRPTPIHTLVSQHRDGQFIGSVVRRFGILPIAGSTTRGGAAGLRNLLAVLRQGGLIGITPDGPRGPRASGRCRRRATGGARRRAGRAAGGADDPADPAEYLGPDAGAAAVRPGRRGVRAADRGASAWLEGRGAGHRRGAGPGG